MDLGLGTTQAGRFSNSRPDRRRRATIIDRLTVGSRLVGSQLTIISKSQLYLTIVIAFRQLLRPRISICPSIHSYVHPIDIPTLENQIKVCTLKEERHEEEPCSPSLRVTSQIDRCTHDEIIGNQKLRCSHHLLPFAARGHRHRCWTALRYGGPLADSDRELAVLSVRRIPGPPY